MRPKIWMLPSVTLADRALLPNKPGIYYAIAGGEILYIGMTGHQGLRQRWGKNSGRGDHGKLSLLLQINRHTPVKLAYWVRPLWRVKHDEAVEIRHYKPSENRKDEHPVWWIATLDFMVDSVQVAIALLVLYTVWRLRS